MEGTPISELTVDSLYGEFYGPFREYVEKRGGKWTPQYREGRLCSHYIQFPQDTTYVDDRGNAPSGRYDRYRIIFADGSIMFWVAERATKQNLISIPYVYLK